MIQIIVHAYVENKEAIVEVLFASQDKLKIKEKYDELIQSYSSDYLTVYDLPLDTDLNQLDHYPSVAIHEDDFENNSDI